MVILIISPRVVVVAHSVAQECLVGIEIRQRWRLPGHVHTYIEQQRHHNHHGSEHLPAVALRANVGNGGYDAYHVVPAQATAILRADEEKKHGAKHESHVEHEYVYATVWYARIAFDDEI